MVIVAVLGLNMFHPALFFKERVTDEGGLGTHRKAKRQAKKGARARQEDAVRIGSSTSDVEK